MIGDPGPDIMFSMFRFMEKFGIICIEGWKRTEPLGVVGFDSYAYKYCAKYCKHGRECERK